MRTGIAGLVAACGVVVALASANGVAQVDEPTIRLSTGLNYTSGNYGGDVDIEDLYVPVSAALEYGRLGLRITVPYLSVRAPAGTIITDPGGQPVPGSGERSTQSGLGDVIGSATIYDVLYSRELGIALDITGKVKFATADEAKGLGTGESDYSLQADVYKYFGNFMLVGTGGYKVRGDPDGVDLRNALFGSAGGIYRFTESTRGGLFYDYREASFAGSESIRELTAFVAWPVDDQWRLQLYGLTGFSDSSPDFGGGLLVKHEF